jgi:hypothetical protein
VPDIDQAVADKLIVLEVRKALDELEHKLLGIDGDKSILN